MPRMVVRPRLAGTPLRDAPSSTGLTTHARAATQLLVGKP